MRVAAFLLAAVLCGPVFCQTKIIVPFPPGGGADALARLMAPKLTEIWKQQVIVENKPGASGHIGADFVAQSAPDGRTLLMSSTASLTEKNVQQFAPVTLVSYFFGERVDFICKKKSRQTDLRLLGYGRGVAPRRGAFQVDGEDRSAPRSL